MKVAELQRRISEAPKDSEVIVSSDTFDKDGTPIGANHWEVTGLWDAGDGILYLYIDPPESKEEEK
jgi:hypothetical protein